MAQQRLNKKLVTVLTLGLLAVFAGVGVILIASLPQHDPAPYVQQAVRAYEAKDYETAVKAYMQAWQVSEPKDPAWLLAVGRTAREQGDGRVTYGAYAQALTADPALLAARSEFVDFLLELCQLNAFKWSELFRESRKLLSMEGQEDNLLGLYACGKALMYMREDATGDLEPDTDRVAAARSEATESGGLLTPAWALGQWYLTRAVELAPDDLDSSLILASFYEEQGNWAKSHIPGSQALEARLYDQAEQIFLRLQTQPSAPTRAKLEYALFLVRRARGEEALAIATSVAATAPDDPDVQFALAATYYSLANVAQAEQAYVRAKDLAPERLDLYRTLGRFHRQQGDFDKALNVYREALERPINRDSFRANRERFQRFEILVETGEALLAKVETQPDQAEELLARAEQRHDEAIAEQQEFWTTHRLKGMILRARGHLNEAIVELEKADSINPQDDRTKRLLADLYLQTQQPGLAERVLAESLQSAPGNAATLLQLAAVKNRLNKPREALAIADGILKQYPDVRQAMLIKLEAYRQLGQTDQLSALQAKLGGDTLDDLARMAVVAQLQNQPEQAEAHCLEALKRDPANIAALRVLLPMYVEQDRLADAQRVFLAAQEKAPNDQKVAVFALLLSPDKDAEARTAQIREILSMNTDPLERALELARFAVSQKHYDEAAQHYADAAKVDPDNDRLVAGQFALALAEEDWAQAERVALRAGQLNLDGAQGKLYVARLSLHRAKSAQDAGDNQTAKQHLLAAIEAAETAQATGPSSINGQLVLATAYASMRRWNDSVEAYERIIELNPGQGVAHRELARLLPKVGREQEVQTHLETAMRLLPSDPWLREQQKMLMEQTHPHQAIASRLAQLEQEPSDVANLARLAELYETVDQIADADAMWQRALSLAPKDMAITSAGAEFYRGHHQPDKAEAILKQLVRNVSGDDKATAQTLLARHYRALNRMDDAATAYKVAVTLGSTVEVYAEAGEFWISANQLEEAAKWLAKALEVVREQEGSVLREQAIRRRLIDVTLATGQRDSAEAAIEQYITVYPEDGWGYILRGRLCTMQNRREDAIAAFGRAVELEPSNPVAYYQMGRLQKAVGNLAAAIESLSRAKSLAPNAYNYEHRVLLAKTYQAAGQLDLAIAELRSVLDDDPDAPFGVDALANTLKSAGRAGELEALLREYMARDPEEPRWPMALGQLGLDQKDMVKALTAFAQAVKVSNYASKPLDKYLNLLQSMKRYPEIIKLVRDDLPHSKQSALTVMRLANALYQSGQVEEARQQYRVALSMAIQSPDDLPKVAAAMGETLGWEQAVELVRQAAVNDPDNPKVQYGLAAALDQAGQRDEAVTMLRTLAAAEKNTALKYRYRLHLASSLHQAQRLEEAIAAYKDVLTVNAESLEALNNLAYLLGDEKARPDEALPYAQRAFQLARENPYVIDTLGWTLCLAGQYDAAIAKLRESLDFDDTILVVRYHLGEAYRRQGDTVTARQQLEAALKLDDGKQDPAVITQIQESLSKLD